MVFNLIVFFGFIFAAIILKQFSQCHFMCFLRKRNGPAVAAHGMNKRRCFVDAGLWDQQGPAGSYARSMRGPTMTPQTPRRAERLRRVPPGAAESMYFLDEQQQPLSTWILFHMHSGGFCGHWWFTRVHFCPVLVFDVGKHTRRHFPASPGAHLTLANHDDCKRCAP